MQIAWKGAKILGTRVITHKIHNNIWYFTSFPLFPILYQHHPSHNLFSAHQFPESGHQWRTKLDDALSSPPRPTNSSLVESLFRENKGVKTGKKKKGEETQERECKTKVGHERGERWFFPESSHRDSWSTLCNNTQWNFTLWDRKEGKERIGRIESRKVREEKESQAHEQRIWWKQLHPSGNKSGNV